MSFRDAILAPFASLEKQAETLFRLICCEGKILFRLKKQAEKDGLQEKRTGPLWFKGGKFISCIGTNYNCNKEVNIIVF